MVTENWSYSIFSIRTSPPSGSFALLYDKGLQGVMPLISQPSTRPLMLFGHEDDFPLLQIQSIVDHQ